MNERYSLHKITSAETCPFDADGYSYFKFGDKQFAKKFASELFEGFIAKYAAMMLDHNDIVILPSPYLSIPTASNFLCFYFKEYLNNWLFQNNKKTVIESKIYRNQTYVTDYGNLDFDERVKLISNDTYYIDRNFINNKLCIFVDDIKITGSHEHTVNKILQQYDVQGQFIFVYFAELMNREIHPKIENFYNYHAIKNIDDIIKVINSEAFEFNTRIVKYILSFDENEFQFLLKNIPSQKISKLFQLAISNNYHQIETYQNNIQKIKIYNYG